MKYQDKIKRIEEAYLKKIGDKTLRDAIRDVSAIANITSTYKSISKVASIINETTIKIKPILVDELEIAHIFPTSQNTLKQVLSLTELEDVTYCFIAFRMFLDNPNLLENNEHEIEDTKDIVAFSFLLGDN